MSKAPERRRTTYGAGSMKQRGGDPNTWRLRAFTGRDPVSGHAIQIHRTFHGSETAARKALAKLVAEVQAGKFDRTRATVGQLLDKWLEQIGSSRRPSTVAGYRSKIEHAIRPALGDVRLSKLGADDLDANYRAWLEGGLSPTTVRQYHAILSAALRQGERWGWVDQSPARRASPPTVRTSPMSIPTPAQLTQLLRAAGGDPVLATAIALAALTGARRGELCALRWSDVDLDMASVRIERGVTVVAGRSHVGPTKTHQARRIALDEIGVTVLQKRWHDMHRLSEHAESPLVDDPYVLSPNANGARSVNPDTISHRFAALCRKLEEPARRRAEKTGHELKESERWPFRFHDIRHYSVTTLIASGMDIRTVSERHGHAQATMTLNRYAHALPERDRAAAAVLGRALDLN